MGTTTTRQERAAGRKVLTTGDVAHICGVAPRTASKWIDSGLLRGYRIPGSQDRRVTRGELIDFLRRQNMPLGALARVAEHRVLLVACEPGTEDELRRAFPTHEFRSAGSSFLAGVLLESFQPHTVVVDPALGSVETGIIRQNCEGRAAVVVLPSPALFETLTKSA